MVLAEVVRSGFVEGVHRGSVVAVDADGAVSWSLGDPDAPMYPRSANKPLQAAAMLGQGLELDGELLALASASHSGEPFHLSGVERILAGAGLSVDDLQTPADWPLDETARLELARAGGAPSAVAMNCSGKHAAMLATCVAAGWPTATYTEPDHPVQAALRTSISGLAGEEVAHTGVDGCGAPLFALTLVGLARAFARLVTAPVGSPERRVADAVRAYPDWTSGTRRDEAALVRGVPGLVGKAGAECVYAVALGDGRAVALKVDDGSPRARPVVMAAALRRLGVDAPVVHEQAELPLLGAGRPVGSIRPTL